jgi:hypothetical protein
VADNGDEIALTTSLDTQNAKSFSELWKVTRSTIPAKISVGVFDLADCTIPA